MEKDPRAHRVAVGTLGRSPYSRTMMAAAIMAAAASAGTHPDNLKAIETTEERERRKREAIAEAERQMPPPKPRPTTQRLKMVDDAGLVVINKSRAERARINAARADRAARAEAGKARS